MRRKRRRRVMEMWRRFEESVEESFSFLSVKVKSVISSLLSFLFFPFVTASL